MKHKRRTIPTNCPDGQANNESKGLFFKQLKAKKTHKIRAKALVFSPFRQAIT